MASRNEMSSKHEEFFFNFLPLPCSLAICSSTGRLFLVPDKRAFIPQEFFAASGHLIARMTKQT
jgi:hypothetical protein